MGRSSKTTSQLATAFRPIFGIGVIWTCAGSRSTTNSDSPSTGRAVSPRADVRARTSAADDSRPFVIHTLRPRSSQPSPAGTALVEMRVVSLPASGSVALNETCNSPDATRGRYLACNPGLPHLVTGWNPNIDSCTVEQPLIPAPLAAISCSTSAASSTDAPPPPCSGSDIMPTTPILTMASKKSWGNSCSWSWRDQ